MHERRSQHGGRFTCPICKRPVGEFLQGTLERPPFFPFCSERCKLIDLGAWFDADYRIPTKPDEDTEEPAGEPPEKV